uniref:HAUS6 protein n=1 Tax=Gongylonema pulchrum TaxID=637853 RepID=A0A183EMY0_9BILA
LELKFMLDLMYEARCASWALLLCILRRDLSFLSKRFSRKYMEQCGQNTIRELQEGLDQLQSWAANSCSVFQLCILRRDLSFLSKRFSRKYVEQCGQNTIRELQEGLDQLQSWAANSW